MSSLFSHGSGRTDGRDAELVEAGRRRERAFTRDIGDEQALARGDQPRYRSPRLWVLGLLVVIVAVATVRALRHTDGPSIARNCSRAGLVVAPTSVRLGHAVQWGGTGPADGRYALVFDGRPDRVGGGGQVSVASGTPAGRSFPMTDCRAHNSVHVPTAPGRHELRLYHQQGSRFRLVARAAVTVRDS